MSVNVRVPGKDTSNIKSFSVQEDATPIDPSSSSGGVGQITVGLDDFPDAPRLIGDLILTDGSRGKTSGTIRTVTNTDGSLTLTADSALGMFNTDRTVAPHVGTLGTAIQFYCDLVGIQNDVFVDSDISSRAVTYPGWTGNVWVGIKQIMAKEQIEMALVFDRISVRSLRKLTINKDRKTTDGLSVDNNNAAQSVEVYYYNHTYGTQREVFPLRGESQQPSFTVNAGETITVTQQLNASMISVNQPLVQDFVANTSFNGTNGVYSVVGNDGLPVTAAQWTAQGGLLSVRITDNPSIIEISLTGPNNRALSPYRIGMSSGGSNIYNSLHITGTAVVWDKQLLTLTTGVPSSKTSVEIGATVDNPFISTLSDAYNAGVWAAASHAGLNYTVSGSAFNVNRAGQGRDLIQATISDFNTAYPYGTLISAFNSMWASQTIADFNDYWLDQVDLLWENQLFGNVTGARVLNKDANFRVVSATTTESAVQYGAALDTVVGDFNDEWPFNSQATLTTNRVLNPSFEDTSGTTTVRTNLITNPAGSSAGTAWGISPGVATYSEGSALGSFATSARMTRLTTAATRFTCRAAYLASTLYTARMKFRASEAFTSVQVLLRPDVASTTGQASFGTLSVPVGESEFVLSGTSSATAPLSTSGFTLVMTTAGVGATLEVVATLEQSNIAPNIFNGATQDVPDSDLTSSWTGTAHASTSLLTGLTPTGTSGGAADRGAQVSSTQWVSHGSRSVRIIPRTSTTSTYSQTNFTGLTPGQVYTVYGAIRLTAPLTGTLVGSQARSITANDNGDPVITFTQTAPNAAGVYPVRGTFTALNAAHSIRLYNGASAGNGEVWWDDFMLVEGVYTGAYFDGSLTDTHVAGVTTDYAWTGTADASMSNQTVTTGVYLVSDFNDQFAGMTMKDFNVIPLRKDY